MCGKTFVVLILRTTLAFFLVEYVVCGKTESVGEQVETGKGVENVIDDIEKELSNSSVSEIFNFWDEDEESESKGLEEGRKKKQESLISRLLPLLVMPFMMSTMMLPMMLTQMKVMLIKAIFLGKLAIIFATLNILRNMGDTSGLYSHNVHLRRPVGHVMSDPELSKGHYGYTGDEEYGAYVNKKKRR